MTYSLRERPAKLRVLHCIETVGSGGVEQRRLLLAKGLDPELFEQRLVCTQTRGPIADAMDTAGTPVVAIGKFRAISDVRRYSLAWREIRAFRPHIVHGAVFQGNATAMLTGCLARVPIRIAEETSDPTNRAWRANLFMSAMYRLGDTVVAVSDAVAAYLVRIGVPSAKIVTIENGVAVPRAVTLEERAALRDALGFTENQLVIGTVGRLYDDHKRVSDLIEAMAELLRGVPNVRLLVVGDGPDRLALERLAMTRGIGEFCRFVGYQPDTAPYYALMDLFVLASAREAFGLVLAEAMLASVAVVGTAVGGIPSILDNGTAGVLVEPCRPRLLTAALQSILADGPRRKALASAGHRRATARYRPERYVTNVAGLYERLCAKHVGRM
jgi:glycosyltransferase involved in cell wall biosynthesis